MGVCLQPPATSSPLDGVVARCEELDAVFWKWQSADGAMCKARFGGKTGRNPTDRGKPGTKRSVLVDEHGGPLAVVIAGANGPDTKLLDAMLAAIVIDRPDPNEHEQHLCLDKGDDNSTGTAAVKKHQYVPHIRRIGEESKARKHKKSKPRRWVVERTLGWLPKCRALLVRDDKN